MQNTWTVPPAIQEKRGAARASVALAARLTWKDSRGTARFATVVARNISEFGVYIECASPLPLSMYRLVQFQFERDERTNAAIPMALREGRTLAAVYRVSPQSPGRKQGLALRLMIDPRRHMAVPAAAERRATA